MAGSGNSPRCNRKRHPDEEKWFFSAVEAFRQSKSKATLGLEVGWQFGEVHSPIPSRASQLCCDPFGQQNVRVLIAYIDSI
jgi:hypothetical protein